MSKSYRVVDVRCQPYAEVTVSAYTAEEAGRLAFGLELVRGGNKRATLIAKVYSTSAEGGPLSMVRLYAMKNEPTKIANA